MLGNVMRKMRKTCLKVPISNFTLATYLRLGAPRAASLPGSNSFLNNFPLPSPANSQQAHATLPPPPPSTPSYTTQHNFLADSLA